MTDQALPAPRLRRALSGELLHGSSLGDVRGAGILPAAGVLRDAGARAARRRTGPGDREPAVTSEGSPR